MEDFDAGVFVLQCGNVPPSVQVHGSWPAGEFSQHHCRGVTLLVLGLTHIGQARRDAEFARSIDQGARRGSYTAMIDWPGSYTLVAFHRDGVEARADLAGQFPVYYSRRGDELLIGSDPGLLAARHGRGPDPVTAAAHIACPSALPLWSGRSSYSGVARLENGGMLQAGGPGTQTAVSGPEITPVAGRTRTEGAALLRQALIRSVRDRAEGGALSSDFSGGLDSTSLALLAAAASGAEGRAVTSVHYHQPLAPADDLADAVRFAALDPRINLVIVEGSDKTLPFASLMMAPNSEEVALSRSAEPAPQALSERAAAQRLAAASSAGARVHLTGEGADALLLPSPSYLGRLARPRLSGQLLRHSAGYARLRYASPVVLAQRAVRLAHTTPACALGRLAAELRRPAGRRAGWADLIAWWPPGGEAVAWLTASIRGQLADLAGDPATRRLIPGGLGPADLAALTDLRRSGDAHRYLRQLGARMGLSVQAPFLDTDVIRAALSVSTELRSEPWSYKPLLGEALAGLLPGEVLQRRTKGDYSTEDYRGARKAAVALRGLLRQSRLADLGVIEPGRMEPVLDRMVSGIAVPLGPVNMLLATELWLRSADAKAGVPATC